MSDWVVPGYTQLTVLGAGGFGRVVLARHDASSRVVAIKYLHSTDEPSRAQFRHEAAILRRVVSPHVARLYEFVETAGGAAIVMEAVPGVSLKEILDRHGALPPEAALAILRGSLLGLAAAHAVGTVHRDYKPGNVLVQPNQQSKLVDFGIALLSGHSGHSGGTPAYMAPEQWQGAPATPATDVYAATCVFFFCVTGSRPFRQHTDTESLRQAHRSAPPPVEQVPEPVRALVARGMAKDVSARPPSAAAFVRELEAAAVAGYGRDWETRGWQRLAGYAGALLAVSPMAWLVSSTGVLTSAGATATATGAAGAAGTAAAAKSAIAAAAAKIAAVVVGAAVVVSATVIIVNTTGDDPPGVTQEALSVSTVTERADYQVNVDVSAQVVRVSGVGGADALNAALRAPVDTRVRQLRANLDDVRSGMRDSGDERWDDPATITITATVLLQNADYLSVRYDNEPDTSLISNSSWQSYDTVTVDLRTGKALTIDQIYRPGAAGPLAGVLVATGEMCESADLNPTRDLTLTEDNLGDQVKVAFTRDHASFTVELPALDRPNACGIPTVDIPYGQLADVLDPTLVRGLTAG
ncbi:serine/threonine-protein kinase [Actinophytocola sp.]|uniref:serine/threonine-protein kinase n=1 Tax=Actinophytocola sp. TaxID=1872138 RepID=UPI003899AD5B